MEVRSEKGLTLYERGFTFRIAEKGGSWSVEIFANKPNLCVSGPCRFLCPRGTGFGKSHMDPVQAKMPWVCDFITIIF